MWWLVGVLVALSFLWYGRKFLAGYFTPPQVSGKIYLHKKLAQYGIDISSYGDGFSEFLVNRAISVAKMRSELGGDPFHGAFVDHLDGAIYFIGAYEAGQLDKLMCEGELFEKLNAKNPIMQRP
jgi:hypothetical protein